MLNKRTLPNLRPGENVLEVTADRIAEGQGLDLAVNYLVKGEARTETRFITRFPHDFEIDIPGVGERVYDNYDQHFNDGDLRMVSLKMRLRPVGEGAPTTSALREADARAAFAISSPHPAEMINRQPAERAERDVRETSGFFPQSNQALKDDQRMKDLIRDLNGQDIERRWVAAEDLGNYSSALDTLLAALPNADGDLTLFICKALAQIKDRKAMGPLLEKWKRAPRGAPGTRYIPDALAAIGDRSVAPQLIAPLEKCRFDFRFHIVHALAILGGPDAERVLRDLAENDPFPAMRQEAARALANLQK